MKTIHLLILLACFALGNAPAMATLAANLIGQPDINISATGQDFYYQQVSSKTNVVRGATNDVTVEKSTITNFTINATSLLDLLTNSFNTNFPPGTQLLLTGSGGFYSFAVSDGTGTNVSSFPVYTVLTSSDLDRINSGTQTLLTTNRFLSAGNITETYTSAFVFQYDDTALTNTFDGTHTKFSLNCLIEAKSSINIVARTGTENVKMTLTGGGEIRGQPKNVFTGAIRARLAGTKSVP